MRAFHWKLRTRSGDRLFNLAADDVIPSADDVIPSADDVIPSAGLKGNSSNRHAYKTVMKTAISTEVCK